jgi:hypothetical protein
LFFVASLSIAYNVSVPLLVEVMKRKRSFHFLHSLSRFKRLKLIDPKQSVSDATTQAPSNPSSSEIKSDQVRVEEETEQNKKPQRVLNESFVKYYHVS